MSREIQSALKSQKEPGVTTLQGANGIAAGIAPPADLQARWQAQESFAEFRAACECFGVREIARVLGYRAHTRVHLAYSGKAKDTSAVQARWEAACSRVVLPDLPMRLRKVGKRGIRWFGQWLHHQALTRLIGRQVVVRGDRRGGLVVFGGLQLSAVCVLQPVKQSQGQAVSMPSESAAT